MGLCVEILSWLKTNVSQRITRYIFHPFINLFFYYRFSTETLCRKTSTASVTHKVLIFSCLTLVSHLLEVPKLSSYAKAEDKLFKYLFGSYQKWVRPVEQLNQTIRVKFGLAISQLVDVVRTGGVGVGAFRVSALENGSSDHDISP